MKKYVLILLMIVSSNLFSQTVFTNPNIDRQNHSNSTIHISKIEKYSDKTVVHFVYKNDEEGVTISIDPNTFIRKTGGTKQYTLIKAIGIPVSPDVKEFNSVGQEVYYKLIFPKIPNDIHKIDIVECGKSNCFNFYGVRLENGEKKILEKSEKINISTDLVTTAVLNKKTEKFDDFQEEKEITFFEFNKKMTMFKHTTPTITSTYIIKSMKENKEKKQWECNIVSDTGNKYFMILQKNDVIFLYIKNDDTYLLDYRIKRTWFEE